MFENARLDGEYIKGTIEKLLRKVKEKFYGSNDGTTSTVENQYIQANMNAPHQTDLCQFCQLGNCPYNRQDDIERIVNQFDDLDVDGHSDYDQYDDYDYRSDSWY